MGSGSDSDEGNNSDEEVRAQRAQKGVAPGADSIAGEKPPPLPGQEAAEEDEGPGVEKVAFFGSPFFTYHRDLASGVML